MPPPTNPHAAKGINMCTKLKYGNTNTFLIHGTAANLLVDTDYAGTLPLFYKAIKAHGIKICDIHYLLATHWHPDHIGLASELISRGVQLLLPDVQLPFIHFSDEIFKRDPRLHYEPISTENALVFPLGESRALLQTLGIGGELIHTPSHSPDSISLLLDSGECFVGDLEPAEYLGGYEQNEPLKRDWAHLLRRKPKVIHFAHANEKRL